MEDSSDDDWTDTFNSEPSSQTNQTILLLKASLVKARQITNLHSINNIFVKVSNVRIFDKHLFSGHSADSHFSRNQVNQNQKLVANELWFTFAEVCVAKSISQVLSSLVVEIVPERENARVISEHDLVAHLEETQFGNRGV